MKLSVIIVNYNVQFFLEQALLSVRKASVKMPVEVFVVDNNSVDDSVSMVKSKFPEVQIIANKENVGFSRANNQAIALSKGEYVLLLNPDTVVREDTFEKTVEFLDAHPEAGALGVKMIDGKGNFLPESKRGFPSPEVAFYKTFGLSTLFPKSRRFNKYHLGFLSEEETNEVDVLSGAFMMLRKSVLEEIGYLDEDFFMYGEDIDLSYRVIKAGYKNYYFADTTIIHYKGESTKKGSLNYVRTFYQAMIIFAQKHFGGQKASLLIFMLNAAIYFRAALTLGSNLFRKSYQPVLDALIIFAGMYFIKDIWAVLRFHNPSYFKDTLLIFNYPLYILIWLFAVYFAGGYDKSAKVRNIVYGICVGSLIIAAVYGFLPSHLRASRMLIVFGTIWALISSLGLRSILSFFNKGSFVISKITHNRMVIVGDQEESKRVLDLLFNASVDIKLIGIVSPNGEDSEDLYLGNIRQLNEIVQVYAVNEIIFCGKNISSEHIIFWMSSLGPEINYKIVPEKSVSIIGSNSKDSAGDLYTIDINFKIQSPIQRRNKRVFDVMLSLILILFAPFYIWFTKPFGALTLNAISVLLGQKSWIGYSDQDEKIKNLPKIKEAVFSPVDALPFRPESIHTIHRINLFYAKDYTVSVDWDIFSKSIWRRKR